MGKIILYHGTPDQEVEPTFGKGDNKHDYGKGYYGKKENAWFSWFWRK